MEFGVVPFSALRKRDQWKVEYFIAEDASFASVAYPMVSLGELLTERRETIDPTEYAGHAFNYIGLENVEGHTGDLIGFEPCPGEKVRSRSKIYRNGDILYGRLRPYLNKVHFVDHWLGAGICSGEFIVLQARPDRIHPEFCRYLLASSLVQERISGLQVGSTHPRLSVSDLYEIRVPLPPMKTQEEMLTTIRRCEHLRRQAKADASSMSARLSLALIDCLKGGGALAAPATATIQEQRYPASLPAAFKDSKPSRNRI